MASFKAQMEGDVNSAGGSMTGGAISVLVNGRKAGIPGIAVSPHPIGYPHIIAITTSTCQSVLIEGKPAVRTDIDKDTCGHNRIGGSNDVLIGN